jgi:hypothetical protein
MLEWGQARLGKTSKAVVSSYSIDPDTSASIELGEPLGSGSFSHVFKLVDKDSEGALIEKFGQCTWNWSTKNDQG